MNKIFEIAMYPYERSPDQDAAQPVSRKVVIIGAGPIGLAAAIDLAQNNIPVVAIDDNDKVSWGSRAICFAKRPLEILDRLGCGDEFVDNGVTWNTGKVFFDEQEVYAFNLLAEDGHKRPAFINLQQYYFEKYLIERVQQLQDEGKPIELRGKNALTKLDQKPDHCNLTIDTPEGEYQIKAEWVIACDGANSPTRKMMGLDFVGRVFEDNFLIADVIMDAQFPTQRWFWFDPPFNRGQSALLHKQPDNVWRIDLQLGWDIDREKEIKPENVIPRLKVMLGENVDFELEWVSIYTFQCRRMEKFHHNRVFFAGDSAHQVSPFGARGANSGLQDTDNLCWKLKLVIEGTAPQTLLQSYDDERVFGAQENILNSTRSTDFITPKSEISRIFRNAVLNLSQKTQFAQKLVNSGRLSVPCIYENSPLNGDDDDLMPTRTRPGAPLVDAAIGDQWLIDLFGNQFHLLAINQSIPDHITIDAIKINTVTLETNEQLKERYLGEAATAIYLIRPDQHVVARWQNFDQRLITQAFKKSIGTQ